MFAAKSHSNWPLGLLRYVHLDAPTSQFDHCSRPIAPDYGCVEQIDLSDEASHKSGQRPVVDFLGTAHLLDSTVIHHHDPVRHVHGLGLVMCHVDCRCPQPLLDLADFGLHCLAQLQIQCPQWLVHQKNTWRISHSTCHGDALLLPAGKFRRVTLFHAGELHHLQQLLHPLADLLLGHLALRQSKRDVLADRHVRKQGVVLEHHANAAFVGRQVGDIVVTEPDHAA